MIFWTENPNHEFLLIVNPCSNTCWETSCTCCIYCTCCIFCTRNTAEQLFGLEPFVVVVVRYEKVELEVTADELELFEEQRLI